MHSLSSHIKDFSGPEECILFNNTGDVPVLNMNKHCSIPGNLMQIINSINLCKLLSLI